MTEHLTIRQASKRMGLSDQTLRDLCQRGELVGAIQEHERGPWRIPIEAVDLWIEANITRRRRRRIITFAGISAVVALVVGLVSGLADWDKAVLRLQQWGVMRSYAPASDNETLIIVFDFSQTENVVDTDIAGEISRAIKTESEKNSFNDIRVEIDPRQLKPQDKERAKKNWSC